MLENQVKDVTLVLTSCNRPDDLEKTLTSIASCDLESVKRIIVIEDSTNHEIGGIVSRCLRDIPHLFIQNEQNMGQIHSVDRAYAEVDTDYIYHCEDDWVFPTGLFIPQSRVILDQFANIHAVMVRAPEETPLSAYKLWDRVENGVEYWEFDPKHHRRYGSFSFNPGLRRTSDYLACAPFSNMGPEREICLKHKLSGFRLAHLKDGDVLHIGDDTATVKKDEIARKKSRSYLLQSASARIRFLLFRLFG
ncbi:glycosyltransferase family A protein [Thalassobius sp. I31.1]|uniref:glycosyltransferase family 2 protein n=1 Tax=Thalassobius sp. I31.1 TaxID=2109912 RepID=UPI000D1C02DD|nr:glycosyltransferase family A protein [Thalassobius sp. I31.1]